MTLQGIEELPCCPQILGIILLSPAVAIEPEYLYWNLQAVSIIDTRAGLIKSEGLLSGDRYGFIRDAYMQRRAFLVNDGMATDSFKDDGF